jgi:hypothetical protein
VNLLDVLEFFARKFAAIKQQSLRDRRLRQPRRDADPEISFRR